MNIDSLPDDEELAEPEDRKEYKIRSGKDQSQMSEEEFIDYCCYEGLDPGN